ncbi:S-adenosylmethionine:tRNA ribosyltransferase-isomerase [Streptomyces scopuliridis]|uniref:S-adenosylmethionine:tRNA ribosyltransferase-isomerase n=1 Tax=Streptomyces scopuliridis TaxID=452529 RepID=UPI00368EC93D
MSVLPALRVPEELSARVPAEQRGSGRDDVRLLVSRGTSVTHHAFRELPEQLRAGDVLVVNTSATLPAAVSGRLGPDPGGEPVVVHFSTRGDDGRWAVELRTPRRDSGAGTTLPRAGGPAGAVVRLPGGEHLVLDEPLGPVRPIFVGPERLARRLAALSESAKYGRAIHNADPPPCDPPRQTPRADPRRSTGQDLAPGGSRLWWAHVSYADVPALLGRYGRPIRYGYTDRDQPLSAYQTVFARPSPDGAGSAEMPSAGRPFTARLVAELKSRGVRFAPITLHTGVASAEAHEPPYPERFEVPRSTALLVNAAAADGGRVIVVGTTAVRALESAAGADGVVRAASGWTDLVITPRRGVRVVDGLLTGLHEPESSHLLMLAAIAGRAALARGYEEALRGLYLWHEFGDVHLLLPAETVHGSHC